MALKKFSIAIHEDSVKDLDKLTKILDRSRNWLVGKAIDEFLEKNRKLLQNSVDKCEKV